MTCFLIYTDVTIMSCLVEVFYGDIEFPIYFVYWYISLNKSCLFSLVL